MAGNWIRDQIKKWLQKTGIEIDIEPSITLFGIITLSAGKMEIDPDEWTEEEKGKISDTLKKTVGISMEDFQTLLRKEIIEMGIEKIRSDFNEFMESRQKFDQVIQFLRRNPFMTIEEFLDREENRIHGYHFVGREREWEGFHRFLETSPQRIELMIGEGGKGKTRMAISFAKRAQKLVPLPSTLFIFFSLPVPPGNIPADCSSLFFM